MTGMPSNKYAHTDSSQSQPLNGQSVLTIDDLPCLRRLVRSGGLHNTSRRYGHVLSDKATDKPEQQFVVDKAFIMWGYTMTHVVDLDFFFFFYLTEMLLRCLRSLYRTNV